MSVALAIGLALTLTSAPGRLAGRAPANRSGTAAAGLPRYFAQFAATGATSADAKIRSVSTGAVVASAPSPRQSGWTMVPDAMAAAPGGRTFYVTYYALPSGPRITQVQIYRLSVGGHGLALIKGGVITHSAAASLLSSMAVSPDGTKLALTVPRPLLQAGPNRGTMDEIVVVDLRTGVHRVSQGGLDRSGRTLLLQDVSWTADGRSLVFLALWCSRAMSLDLCQAAVGPASSRTQQVRSIPVTSAGGSLARGPVLLGQRGSPGGTIAHALAGPRPGELTLVLLSGRTATTGFWPVATVERVAAGTGSVLGVDYRLVDRRPATSERYVELGADPSGQHQLLIYSVQIGLRTGWIGQHELHPFPGPQPYFGYPVTAW